MFLGASKIRLKTSGMTIDRFNLGLIWVHLESRSIVIPLVLKHICDAPKSTSFMQYLCLFKKHLFGAVEYQS